MRRQLVLLGAFALGSGAAMAIMLGQLRSDFFRAYLLPWQYVSYATMAVGAALLVLGALQRPQELRPVDPGKAARLLVRLAMLNAVAAALFLIPVLFPSFRLPILITQWPGIYMVLAYFSFLVVGVLGMAVWSLLFARSNELFSGEGVGALGFWVQLVLTEVGAYVLAFAMFAGGYVGSWLSYTGAGPVAVGAEMEFSVIPSAVAIFMVAAGTVVGVANALMSGRSVRA